jgi:hypothetical protein
MPAVPTVGEVKTYTKGLLLPVTLAGITKRQFTPARQLSVRKVFAANAKVHYFYVVIRYTLPARARARRLAGPSVSFMLSVRTNPSRMAAVKNTFQVLGRVGGRTVLVSQIAAQFEDDGCVLPDSLDAATRLAVVAVNASVETDQEPPAYVGVAPAAPGAGGDQLAGPPVVMKGSDSARVIAIGVSFAALVVAAVGFRREIRRCGAAFRRPSRKIKRGAKAAKPNDSARKSSAGWFHAARVATPGFTSSFKVEANPMFDHRKVTGEDQMHAARAIDKDENAKNRARVLLQSQISTRSTPRESTDM